MRVAVLVLVVVAGCSGKRATPEGWRAARIGSTYETRTVTRMQQPFEHVTETTTRQTLVARTDAEAKVKLVITEGANTTTQNVTVALRDDKAPAPHDGSTVTRSDETCTVPAGTFPCTRTTVEVGPRSTVTWTAKQVPVPLRTIVTNDNMTITTELTSYQAP